MSEEKRNIAVPLYRGASNYVDFLQELLEYIAVESPTEAALLNWVKENTRAESDDGIRRRLQFLEGLDLIEVADDEYRVTETGHNYLDTKDSEFLYQILSSNVYAFNTVLKALTEGPKTDDELGQIIKEAHPQFGWNDSTGPAQHRAWLQSLGYVSRSGGSNELTDAGRKLVRKLESEVHDDLQRGSYYTQDELEEIFETNFGRYIKGINPRTDSDGDLDYIIVTAKEDGPYDDHLGQDKFTYLGEGLEGDQEQTTANEALIQQAKEPTAPIYFFYQPEDRSDYRYEGLVDVTDYDYVDDGDRMVYEFTMELIGPTKRAEESYLPEEDENDDSAEDDTNDDDSDWEETDFESIAGATETVLERCAESEYENLLRKEISLGRIKEWDQALTGFEPNSFVTPDEEQTLLDLESTLATLYPELEAIAEQLNIGSLNAAEPAEVVFLAFLRETQEAEGLGTNANQAKLSVIKSRGYRAFDNPDHPLLTQLRSGSPNVYKLTAPPDYWLTTLRYRVYGFEPDEREHWEDIEYGDILLFHVAGDPMHPHVGRRSGTVIGAAIAGQTPESDYDGWWYDATTGGQTYPYLVAFDRLFLTAGAAELIDPPEATADANTIERAIDSLEKEAVSIGRVNEVCRDVADDNLPAQPSLAEIDDDTEYGRREAILDLLAEQVTEVSPVAIYPDFEGEIPADVFEDLHFPDEGGIGSATELAEQITAALRSDKHIIFTGPPGTGKTEVAQQVAEYLESEYPYFYSGFQTTTATADWSTFDTVGGYMPDGSESDSDELDFSPGIVLNRFKERASGLQRNEPLIIDELNRADIDKAFGQLFTLLSGQSAQLPYLQDDEEVELLNAADLSEPAAAHEYVVPESWRIFATMNSYDKTSLYEMSYAFMRRFAFIRVDVPSLSDIESDELDSLLAGYLSVWDDIDVDDAEVEAIGRIWQATNSAVEQRAIGPAIVEDILRYISNRGGSRERRMTQAVISFIFPQLDGVPERRDIVQAIAEVEDVSFEELDRTARDMLQIDSLNDE